MRASTELELVAGWPWLIEASLLHPSALGHAGAAGFELVGEDGTAESAFRLELLDASGAPVPVSFERLGAPFPGPVQLETDGFLELAWRLTGEASSTLAAGRYTLTLQVRSPGFETRSPPVHVTLTGSAAGGSPTASLVRAEVALRAGELSAAAADLEAILSVDPEHIQALTRQAELRELQGDLEGAHRSTSAALNAALKRHPDAPEGGPRHLWHRQAKLAEQLDGGLY